MTAETKAAVHKWISENARGIPGGGDVFGFNDSLTDVNIDGQINLAELAERIEAAERERCAVAAEGWHNLWITDKGRRRNYGSEIAAKIRSGEPATVPIEQIVRETQDEGGKNWGKPNLRKCDYYEIP